MDLKEIQQVLKLMEEHDLNSFQLETKDFKVRLRRGPEGISYQVPTAPAPAVAPQAIAPAAAATPAEAAPAAAPAKGGAEITSPMVGTFYQSPSPEAAAFVKVGDKVQVGQVVCIVEAMKVMNEIQSTVSGTITEIAVTDATPVQFGETLFFVDPD